MAPRLVDRFPSLPAYCSHLAALEVITVQTIDPQQLRAALPDLHTTLKLAGLAQPVGVWRDDWGIPHIRAGNEADLFFAQGFATAQDRLWQMDYDRHQALGRWAEWAGEVGLARDRLLRASGMAQAARADLQVSSPQAQRHLLALQARGGATLAEMEQIHAERVRCRPGSGSRRCRR